MKNNNPIINPFINPSKTNPSYKGMKDFYAFDIDKIDNDLKTKKPDFWTKKSEDMALNLFKEASKRVPAYKKFLKKNKINPEKIKTITDFKKIPFTDKNNYLKKYPLKDLCWDGKIERNTLFSVSSGSSGKPFFWPRSENLEIETSLNHALIFKKIFGVDKKSALVIDSFSMGIYIAGVITLNSSLRSSELGMPITIITPGIEMNDILRAVKELGGNYDQIILAGYPPFVKDIIEEGELRGINWKKYTVKFLFATESISESFRDYVLDKVKSLDKLSDSINIYGSADAGMLGFETPISTSIRRLSLKNQKIYEDLWGENTFVPTFVQYNPMHKYFEIENDELIFSCYGGLPLLRYNIHDKGMLYSFDELIKISKSNNSKITKEGWKLPFLSVFGKSDLTISFYGLMIYPQNIKSALEHKKFVEKLTGRFLMQKRELKEMQQEWEIYVELKKGIKDSKNLRKKLKQHIINTLLLQNLEYQRLHSVISDKAEPKIICVKNGDEKYFNKKSIKQRWIT